MERPRKPMTRHGYTQLSEELNNLVQKERPIVLQKIADAAAEGDRSENAEYIYGRKKLRELDKRIRYLNSLLDQVRLVDPEKLSGDQVCFGCTVTVIDEEGQTRRWRLVGEGETDFTPQAISWNSPVAKALMGKPVGAQVEVQRPAGETVLEIVKIEFVN